MNDMMLGDKKPRVDKANQEHKRYLRKVRRKKKRAWRLMEWGIAACYS